MSFGVITHKQSGVLSPNIVDNFPDFKATGIPNYIGVLTLKKIPGLVSTRGVVLLPSFNIV